LMKLHDNNFAASGRLEASGKRNNESSIWRRVAVAAEISKKCENRLTVFNIVYTIATWGGCSACTVRFWVERAFRTGI
jgi:hypothetical protein